MVFKVFEPLKFYCIRLSYLSPKIRIRIPPNAMSLLSAHCHRAELNVKTRQKVCMPVTPGPNCSELTMLLVNISLKFQTLISELCQNFFFFFFFSKKCEKLLQFVEKM